MTAAQKKSLAREKEHKEKTVREEEKQKQQIQDFVQEVLSLSETSEYDPEIYWEDIGVDLLMIDEAHHYKNLYMASGRRTGGKPLYMGGSGEGSKRAWQLAFRSEIVRKVNGGAGGIYMLTATPIQNSPLELYSMISYIDARAWQRMGILTGEVFIDRYAKIELEPGWNLKGQALMQSACRDFKDSTIMELQDIVFRYMDFWTTEMMGLKVPETTSGEDNLYRVKMNAEQDALYEELEEQLKESSQEDAQRDQLKIMGQMARIALHPALKDYSYDDGEEEALDKEEAKTRKAAKKKARAAILNVADPHCPKIDACAHYIIDKYSAKPDCGFIVFCEQIIVQEWMKQVLVEYGLKEKQVAILNAETAGGLQGRMEVADQFNGDQYNEPKYAVVVANQIAYEGIDGRAWLPISTFPGARARCNSGMGAACARGTRKRWSTSRSSSPTAPWTPTSGGTSRASDPGWSSSSRDWTPR
jgi:hypothetical protein